MRIVPVAQDEVAYLVQLGKELVEAGSFGITGPDFDWDYTMKSTRDLLGRADYYIRMAYDDNDRPCGFVAGHVAQFYFSPKILAYEDAWFVREGTPSRAKIAIGLMRGLMHWALDAQGALLLQSGDIASINSTAVWELYKHMGFTHFGAIYKYSRGLA
jgi:hypothetical protein